MSRVSIVGATGMVGRAVVRALQRQNHKIRAIVRNPKTARSVLADDVELVPGDLSDIESLRTGLEGVDSIVLSMPLSVERPGDFNAEIGGTLNVISCLADQHIQMIKVSEINAGSDPKFRDLEAKAESERRIVESGNPFTILRPTMFMDAWYWQLRAGNDVLSIGTGERSIHWLALDDFARWIARSVQNSDVMNTTLTAQGKHALTMPEAASRVATAIGATVVKLSPDAAYPPNASPELKDTLRELFVHYDRAPEVFDGRELWDRLGAPEVSFDDFVTKNAARLTRVDENRNV